MSVRRVVTGYDAAGAPTLLFDGDAPCEITMPPEIGASAVDLWRSESLPLDTTATGDPTVDNPFVLMPPGSLFRIIDLEPGDHTPLWHTTASVDFNYIASGEAKVLLGDEGAVTDEIHLVAGDTFVARGPGHAWMNSGEGNLRIVSACVAAALPAGVEAS
jgi:hypothetical protein